MHPVQTARLEKIVKKINVLLAVFDFYGNFTEKFHKNSTHFLLKITQNRVIIVAQFFLEAVFITHFAQMGCPYLPHGPKATGTLQPDNGRMENTACRVEFFKM